MRIGDWSSDLCSSDLNKYLEGHQQKIAEFDEAERQLKADIRACEAIVEKERIEDQSNQFSKILTKIAGSGGVDLAALLADSSEERRVGKGCVVTCRFW